MNPTSKAKVVTYNASPTASEFHRSNARIKLLVGPVGSGSSSACLFDCMMRCVRQTPDPYNVRKRTVLVCRNSYPKLRTTVKRTMEHWIPDSTGFELTGQAPITGTLERSLGDGTTMKLEFILMAFDEPSKIEDDLRSFEFSDLWINEAKENHPWILKYGQQRLGRYPALIPHPDDTLEKPLPPIFNGCDDATILLDTNMYDDDSWLYKFFHETHSESQGIKKFEQPPALLECSPEDEMARYFEYLDVYLKENPAAENIKWLARGYNYYWDITETSPETVWTDVLNKVGSVQSGNPVFSSYYYNDRMHYKSTPHEPNPDYPLLIGVDWGIRFSAYVICQYIDATLHILDEQVIQDKGLEAQMTDNIIPLLNTKYSHIPDRTIIADPAGRAKDPIAGTPLTVYTEQTWGIKVRLPMSNKPSLRIEAMKELLRRSHGVEAHSNISIIRKGFQGKYQYKRIAKADASGNVVFREEPDKNFYSHPMDALCYVALDVTSTPIVQLPNAQQNNGPLVVV